jgi:hypothetical protein
VDFVRKTKLGEGDADFDAVGCLAGVEGYVWCWCHLEGLFGGGDIFVVGCWFAMFTKLSITTIVCWEIVRFIVHVMVLTGKEPFSHGCWLWLRFRSTLKFDLTSLLNL